MQRHLVRIPANSLQADADAGFVAGEAAKDSLARREVKYAYILLICCGTAVFAFNACYQLKSMHCELKKLIEKAQLMVK